MDWDDVRFLLALRRRGSLAAAARALGVDQTTVGRRLNALERELGARLFERQATGHTLTAAGLRASDLGAAMEASAETLERELGGRDAGVEGAVKVTAPGGFVPTLAGVFAQLREDHPRLVIELLVDNASLDLSRREADIAVRMAKPAQADLVVRRVTKLPWALFVSETYVRRRGMPPPDLAGHDVVGFEAPLVRTPGGQWLTEHARGARIVLRTNNVQGALDCAAAGVGVAAAPVFMAKRDARLQRLVRPRDVGASYVYLVALQDVSRMPRVRTTIDRIYAFLRDEIQGSA